MTGINSEQDSELTFLTGIGDDGTVASQSFWTWNEDNPATYGGTSYESKWGLPTAGAAGGVVTFGFDAASNWTAAEQSAFVATLDLWAAVANISFQQVADASTADIDIERSSTSTAEGGITSLYPGDVGGSQLGSAVAASITIDTSVPGFGPIGSSFSDYGGYPWMTLLHEEGHALGLGHSGPYDGTDTPADQQYTAYDTRAWSIMSYIDPTDSSAKYSTSEAPDDVSWGVSKGDNGDYYGNEPTTMMPLDILAIQRIYGLPTDTPLSGGQVFGFNTNIAGPIEPFFDFTKNTTPIVTLWDEGVGNTLDLSGFASPSTVNLADGAFSSVDGLIDNIAIAYGTKIDTVIGGAGDDVLTANSDGDVLVGGAGDDSLYGGSGADTFKYLTLADSPGLGDTLYNFQTGVDVIDLSALKPQSETVTQSGGFYLVEVTTANGDLQIQVASPVSLSDLNTGYSGVTLTGTAGYDHLVGGPGNDVIIGGGGADSLTGGGGSNTFKYTAASDSTAQGYDIITDFEHGVDVIDLSAVTPTNISLVHSGGATFLFAATPGGSMEIAAIGDVEGNDLITGSSASLYLVGDDNGDTLIGGAGADSVHGGAGNDVIIGGGGADALFGGAGSDTFKYVAVSDSTPQAYDIIQDFQTGTDKLDLTALNPTDVSIVHDNGGTFIFGVGGNYQSFQIGSTHDINAADIIGLTNGAFIVGDSLGDTLIGSALGDNIVGGTGNDVIIGGGGSDALFGGAGADTFKYLATTDSTPQASDLIEDFQTGTDKLDLSALNPIDVSIVHNNGATFIFGVGANYQSFQIGSLHDINASDIVGLTSGAYIVGDSLGDTLVGSGFGDNIVGGSGNDVIIGGGGADALYGGAGADTFKYVSVSDSTLAAPDVIQDFVSGTDKIDLTAVHAGAASASYGLAYTASASYLFVDTNGDGANDMLIEVANPHLHTTDILW